VGLAPVMQRDAATVPNSRLQAGDDDAIAATCANEERLRVCTWAGAWGGAAEAAVGPSGIRSPRNGHSPMHSLRNRSGALRFVNRRRTVVAVTYARERQRGFVLAASADRRVNPARTVVLVSYATEQQLCVRGAFGYWTPRARVLEVISQTPQQDEATGEVQHPEKVLYVMLVTHNDSSVVLKPRE
jgi:hypothetical protein